MTVDHIIPRVAGGTDDIDNLQPMCCRCNEKKGHKGYEKEAAARQLAIAADLFKKRYSEEHFAYGVYNNQLMIVTVKTKKHLGKHFEEKGMDFYLEVAKEKGLFEKIVYLAHGNTEARRKNLQKSIIPFP